MESVFWNLRTLSGFSSGVVSVTRCSVFSKRSKTARPVDDRRRNRSFFSTC